jgi:hypothetical protein
MRRNQRGHLVTRDNRRNGGGILDKREDWQPLDAREFLDRRQGMRKLEYIAGQRGRDEAIRFERESWLPTLERWLEEARQEEDEKARDILTTSLEAEIKRLRRCLGLNVKQSPDERRAKTRERVRALRASRLADQLPRS